MSLSTDDESRQKNRILAALSESAYQRLAPHLKPCYLDRGQIIYEAGEPMQLVYFPLSAMISDVYTMESGVTSEIALVGNEGFVGLPVFWGGNSNPSSLQVQIAGSAIALDAGVLKNECDRCEELAKLLLLYTQAVFTQVSLNVACSNHHAIEQRFARWLLSVQDCVHRDDIELTQEFISYMLGVRRAGVSSVASILQKRGFIRYSRGHINICDRPGLEAMTCECYHIVKREYLRLLGDY